MVGPPGGCSRRKGPRRDNVLAGMALLPPDSWGQPTRRSVWLLRRDEESSRM